MRYLIVLVLLSTIPKLTIAQYATKYGVSQNMKWSSIGAHVGTYGPRLYAYNDVYFEDFSEGKFTSNTTFGGTLSYRLVDNWYLRGGLDYWNQSVQTEEIIISDQPVSERVRVNLIMAQLAAVYELELTRHIYARGGIGGVISRMHSDHQRFIGDTMDSFEAARYPIMALGFGSLNYTFDGHLDVGVELRGVYGRSNHFVGDFGKIAMSTTGISALFRVTYNFQNRWFIRKSHGAFRNHDSRR
ncbi:MAG: hypothetical protein RIC80_15480 [Cyclobacteriaceae bacterium]